jgi:hypothetical protein
MALSPSIIASQTKVDPPSGAAYRSSFIGQSGGTPVTITQADLTANGGAPQAGDVVLCWVLSQFEWDGEDVFGSRQNLPAEFTPVTNSSSANVGTELGWRVAGASEGDYTATGGSIVYSSQMVVVVVQGVSAPYLDNCRIRGFSTNTPYFQGVAPLSDGVVILMGTAAGDTNTYTPPTGTTSRFVLAGGGFGGFYTRVMSYDLPSSGPTGDFVPASYSMIGSDTFFYTVAIQ